MLFVDDKKFGELVREALDLLPSEFAEKLNNVAVIVQDNPTDGQLRELGLSKKDVLFGLYRGIPQTKRGSYSGVLPDKITIFKKAIEAVAKTDEEIKVKVRDTVIHEIGHHFGLSDEDLKQNR
ncbi:MAG: metallopeptidase family protein [Candidatus Levybacteria bacterium]|nr:metallopeptidase family protein [Candidatus Levybacteria bacterium]